MWGGEGLQIQCGGRGGGRRGRGEGLQILWEGGGGGIADLVGEGRGGGVGGNGVGGGGGVVCPCLRIAWSQTVGSSLRSYITYHVS